MDLTRSEAAWVAALRLLFVTDGRGDAARIERLVQQALAGGVRAVQLREPGLGAGDLAALCGRLRGALAAAGGLLFVSDRTEVAAAGFADGVQLTRRSLPPAAARRLLGDRVRIGVSVHSEADLAAAADQGADFALLAPVWPTASKPGAPGLGVERAADWTAAARLPVLWLGGVSPARAGELAGLRGRSRPAGVAVLSAIAAATDPAAAARALLAAWAPQCAPFSRSDP